MPRRRPTAARATETPHDQLARMEQELAEAKRLGAELRASEEQLRFSLEAANVGTWDWNMLTGEVQWSDNLERIHGQAPGSFQGTFEGFLGSVSGEDRAHVLRAIQNARENRQDYRVEYRSIRADGEEIWLAGRGRVVYDAGGQPVRMLGVCMDVTERKRLQQHLQQTQKFESLGLLAGGIAHDFNNLITGILGNASLALDRVARPDRTHALLQDVIAAAHQTADLTRQLLAFAGKGRLVVENLDLAAMVPDVVTLVRSSIPQKVELQFDLAPARIEADASQIRQLVMNLILNAAEAIGPDSPGTVFIHTGIEQVDGSSVAELPPGSYAHLLVRDTGCGMDAATVARIFEPFFTTKFSGRGLGLASALGIVRGHRGAVQVESAPGQGTAFRVRLPAVQAPVDALPVPASVAAASGSGAILVVDDLEVVRRTAQSLLEAHGYTVLTAESGSRALEILQRGRSEIRAVVLDVTMPRMDGEQALRQIKLLRPDLPVILASGYAEMETDGRFQQMEVAGFLRKPYTYTDLTGKLAAALRE